MTLDHMTDDDFLFIDTILEKYDNDESITGASELDGFLTALVSSPEPIPASEWLAAIWGGEDKLPAWESEAEATRFAELATKLMNYSAVTLAEAPDDFEALFLFNEDGDEDSKIVFYWCAGYMRAVEIREQLWLSLPDAEAQCLAQIALFGSDEHLGTLEKLNARRLAEFQDQIEPAATDLHIYWAKQRSSGNASNVIPFVRPSNKNE